MLGQGKKDEAKNSVGTAITVLFILSLAVCIIGEIFLTKLVYIFGCTENVYNYSITYGRIILAGAPFMIIYTGLSAIIRSDGSPKYSMVCLLSGAIVNLILDPVLIFGFNMGVAGGAYATIIGQILSCIIAVAYILKMKTVKLEKKDYKIDRSILKTLGYGTSSFIIQMTVLALFVVMNNVMTKYGATSEYGADIPLSVYGVVSKLNNIYISIVLGLAIGSQPILGFNYGAGKYDRVKQTIKKVIIIGMFLGLIYNIMLQVIPKQLIELFATKSDANYELFLDFGQKCCRIFLMVCFLNALEMSCSIIFQSLGSVKKSSFVSFLRQIILFIPICLILSSKIGLMGALYAGPIADTVCFLIVAILFAYEYKKIGKEKIESKTLEDDTSTNSVLSSKVIISISREYGSGGRYIGRLVADKLGIKFYDKELIELVSKESGISEEYIESNEQKRRWGSNLNSEYNEDDKLFIAESKVIKEIAEKESCVIIGRCSDYILKDREDLIRVFIYCSEDGKVNRVKNYYNIEGKNIKNKIDKENKLRAKHYKYYTNQEWGKLENYDLALNSDLLGVEKTAELICNVILCEIQTNI